LLKKYDLTGQKLGKLTVIEKAASKIYKTSTLSRWVCICDCGNYTETYGINLRSGATKSCGCLHREVVRKEPGRSGLSSLFSNYKKTAQYTKREFSITKEQFKQLTSSNCTYCNSPPKNVRISHSKASAEAIKHEKYFYNGLDRVNNNIGYIIENVVPCCTTCNLFKHNLELEEFLEHAKKITEYNQLKQEVNDTQQATNSKRESHPSRWRRRKIDKEQYDEATLNCEGGACPIEGNIN